MPSALYTCRYTVVLSSGRYLGSSGVLRLVSLLSYRHECKYFLSVIHSEMPANYRFLAALVRRMSKVYLFRTLVSFRRVLSNLGTHTVVICVRVTNWFVRNSGTLFLHTTCVVGNLIVLGTFVEVIVSNLPVDVI